MKLTRRQLLACTPLLVATSSKAQASKRVDVVKILSFGCPVCLASEGIDTAITSVARQTGGRFIPAPLPTGEELSGNKERVYYAARDIDASLGETVKRSLYKGSQEVSVPLNELMQVFTWLQSDLPQIEPQMNAIFQRAQSPEAKDAMGRAARLAYQAGALKLPSYILVVNGSLATAIDPSTSTTGSLTSLRDSVITRIQKEAAAS